ncbi:MAG: o-succinylbenzoate synthase [Actinobacteria bacterium]|nr:o-succinylbenzoate synthase [Actinomycetota bacterium]
MIPAIEVPLALEDVELLRVRLPLIEPFAAAHGVEHERDVVLVHVRGGGRDGWGECSALSAPTYTAECTDEAWAYLSTDAAVRVAASAGTAVSPDPEHPMAWCALEVALADLAGASPFSGGAAGVPSTFVIGHVGQLDRVVARARDALAEGWSSIKLKICPGFDVEPLRAVRALSSSISLAADANGSYDRAGLDPLAELEPLDLSYVEQPFSATNLVVHAQARAHTGVPIALDESVPSIETLQSVIDQAAADVINIKPARLGGLRPAYAVARLAVDHGLRVFVGGMLETGVGRSAALALAAQPLFTLPTDLGPSDRYFADDLTEPIEAGAEGQVTVPAGQSLVLPPRPERLAEVVVNRVVIR